MISLGAYVIAYVIAVIAAAIAAVIAVVAVLAVLAVFLSFSQILSQIELKPHGILGEGNHSAVRPVTGWSPEWLPHCLCGVERLVQSSAWSCRRYTFPSDFWRYGSDYTLGARRLSLAFL